jgi:hypothetical protein
MSKTSDGVWLRGGSEEEELLKTDLERRSIAPPPETQTDR